jgi:hypothetical protein
MVWRTTNPLWNIYKLGAFIIGDLPWGCMRSQLLTCSVVVIRLQFGPLLSALLYRTISVIVHTVDALANFSQELRGRRPKILRCADPLNSYQIHYFHKVSTAPLVLNIFILSLFHFIYHRIVHLPIRWGYLKRNGGSPWHFGLMMFGTMCIISPGLEERHKGPRHELAHSVGRSRLGG